jgi:hypothetical protein
VTLRRTTFKPVPFFQRSTTHGALAGFIMAAAIACTVLIIGLVNR